MFRGPVHVDLNLTNGCNLSCSHCHSSSGTRLDGEMTTEEIKKVIFDLYNMGVLRLAIAGGEPFIRRDIIEILSFACSLKGWNVSVITNGLFFNKKNVKELVEKCENLNINISLDGSTPDNYSILRKQINQNSLKPTYLFDQVTKGISTMKEAGFEVSVNFTLTKATIQDWIPTYDLIDSLGADALVGIKFFPGGYGKEHLDQFELPYEMWSQIFADITHKKISGQYEKMQISVPAAWEFYLPLIENDISLEKAEKAWKYRSPLSENKYKQMRDIGDVAGVAELAISSNGDVYPSILQIGENAMLCGNLKDATINEIWNASEILKKYKNLSLDNLNANCTNCKMNFLCGGGSRSRAFSKFATIYSNDYSCPIVKEREAINV